MVKSAWYVWWLIGLVLGLMVACDDPSQPSIDPSPCQVLSSPFRHTLCSFDRSADMRLYWQDTHAQPFYTFDALMKQHGRFAFIMNAGMYDHEFAPIGLTVIDGQTIKQINTNQGQGNFHLMPNGVFWWHDEGVFVDSTPGFIQKLNQGVRPKYATQSGPMLVMGGRIHPAFKSDGTSKKLRNGVGVACRDERTHFIISDEPVNFYEFADVFKRRLGCQNALFLDGGIASALYADHLHRHDKLSMAVMIAVR